MSPRCAFVLSRRSQEEQLDTLRVTISVQLLKRHVVPCSAQLVSKRSLLPSWTPASLLCSIYWPCYTIVTRRLAVLTFVFRFTVRCLVVSVECKLRVICYLYHFHFASAVWSRRTIGCDLIEPKDKTGSIVTYTPSAFWRNSALWKFVDSTVALELFVEKTNKTTDNRIKKKSFQKVYRHCKQLSGTILATLRNPMTVEVI